MHRSVDELDPPRQAPCYLRSEARVEDRPRVRREVVAHQTDALGLRIELLGQAAYLLGEQPVKDLKAITT